MFRFAGIGVFGFVAIGLWIYCVLDVIASEESLIRNLPKTMWLIIVLFVPTIGSVAWLALGRPLYAGLRPGDTRSRAPRAARGPDDDPGWNRPAPPQPALSPDAAHERRLQEREAELERRERELEERERGEPGPETDAAS